MNYELPNVPEDYVHRIGRTGRAGATGIAVSLVAPDEAGLLKDIEKVLRKPIPQLPLPHFARSQPQPQRSAAPAAAARHSQPRQQQLAAEAAARRNRGSSIRSRSRSTQATAAHGTQKQIARRGIPRAGSSRAALHTAVGARSASLSAACPGRCTGR